MNRVRRKLSTRKRYRRNPDARVLKSPGELQQLTGTPGRLKRGDIVAYDRGARLGRVTGASGSHVELETIRGTLRQLEQAMARFAAFRKVAADRLEVGPEPPELGVVFPVGEVLAICYRIPEGPRKGDYKHDFRARSLPDLMVNSDGKSLLIYGNGFEFTDHGIEDR